MAKQNVPCPRLITMLLLTLLVAGCTPRLLGDTEAAFALEDIVAGSGTSRLKTQTPKPSRVSLRYEIEGRRYHGDLYQSPEGSRAGIVLIPGLAPAGKDDHRLVALAYTLARLRFAVVVPDLEELRRYRMRSGNVRQVADAFRYLVSQPELAPEGRAGIAGFSYGAGPVLIAALEPDIHAQVHFVMTLGGYYDLQTIITYFTTGYYRESSGEKWFFRQPNPYAKWVFTLSNADLLEQPSDQAALRGIAQTMATGYDSDLPLTGLAPDAQALYDLLTNHEPEQVSALISRLSPRIRNELYRINPAAHDLSCLRARVILVHGRGDAIIPYTESVALARILPSEQAALFLIDGIAHVDVKAENHDIPQLLGAMRLLLNQRNSLSEPALERECSASGTSP